MKVKITAMAGGFMLLATAAFALPPMLKVFETTYKPAKNGKLAKASCAVCHLVAGEPEHRVTSAGEAIGFVAGADQFALHAERGRLQGYEADVLESRAID